MTTLIPRLASGTRVRMTPEAIAQGLQGRHNRTTGTVTGWTPTDGLMRVRRDGEKAAESYDPKFWEGV